ncbi:MAG: hypothetical protein QG578_1758, partial [Thermodesulfobacteriota bacterium]|nr:hypothetical protein [Thermodesulfobacteriota bacterium]
MFISGLKEARAPAVKVRRKKGGCAAGGPL